MLHQVRYSYAYGYKSRASAEAAIDDMISDCEISLCEDPRAESYVSPGTGETRWRVSLNDTNLMQYG